MGRLIATLLFAFLVVCAIIALRGLKNNGAIEHVSENSGKLRILKVSYIFGVIVFSFMSLVNFLMFFVELES